MHLKTAGDAVAVVVGGTTPKVRDGWMWDLTVPGNNDHDFYVTAGATAILVHNQNSPVCGPGGYEQLSLFDEQPYRAPDGKAFASANGTTTMSGWADPVPQGINREVSPDDVLALQREMGFPVRQAGAADNGNPGAYFASHAERQLALLEPNALIEVSSEMCADCRDFFQALANYRGVTQQVTDPVQTHIFEPS